MPRRPSATTPRTAAHALACALALCLLLASAGGALAAGARQKAEGAVQLTIGPSLVSAPGVAVTMPPVGLSIEYPVMAAALGTGPCPPPALVTELQRLGSPPLQLAGASQDMTVPAGASDGQQGSWEAATLYTLPASFWSQLHCLLEGAKDPLTVGLNMKTGNLAWAQQMATEARGAAVNGLSFSLGNEPDLYALPNYATLDKPLPEEELAAANLYIQLAGGLEAAVPGTPLVGPELALPDRWEKQFPRVLKAVHFQTVGVHLYPLTACATPRAVTIGGLLSNAAGNSPARLAFVVADAQAVGLPAIISEANSASCGGVTGVSDSPAAAVWAVRFVLSALKTGFHEVRFHLSGNSYDPFLVRGSEVVQRPLEAALVALNTWMPLGSTLRSLHLPAARELFATAIAQAGGSVTLIVDNEGSRSQPLVLHATAPLGVQLLRSTHAGLLSETLAPVHGRVHLALAPETIAAISAAAIAPAAGAPAAGTAVSPG